MDDFEKFEPVLHHPDGFFEDRERFVSTLNRFYYDNNCGINRINTILKWFYETTREEMLIHELMPLCNICEELKKNESTNRELY